MRIFSNVSLVRPSTENLIFWSGVASIARAIRSSSSVALVTSVTFGWRDDAY